MVEKERQNIPIQSNNVENVFRYDPGAAKAAEGILPAEISIGSVPAVEIVDVAQLEADQQQRRREQNRERVSRWKKRHREQWAAYMRAYRLRRKQARDSTQPD